MNTTQSLDSYALKEKFCYECGMRPLPWMRPYFEKLISSGMSCELISELISRTAHAPRPSYAYLDYLVQMCRANDIKSTLDLLIKPHERPIKREELPV